MQMSSAGTCPFCETEGDLLRSLCLDASGRTRLLKMLKAMSNPETRDVALSRLPEEFRQGFRAKLHVRRCCPGLAAEACCFALRPEGGSAQLNKREGSCLLCTPEELSAKCATPHGRSLVATKLRKMAAVHRDKALQERVPEQWREALAELLAGAPSGGVRKRPAAHTGPRRAPRQTSRGLASMISEDELQQRWGLALSRSTSGSAPASAAAKAAYRERVLADRATGRRHAGRARQQRAKKGAVVDNETGLPRAKRSARAAALERWCLFYSWAQCAQCGRMQPRQLTQSTLVKDQKVTVPASQCSRCSAAHKASAVSIEDVPEQLRDLSPEAAAALSPLEVDVGPEQRAKFGTGYRTHTTMMRFRWHSLSVEQRLRRIGDKHQRKRAKAAYRYLLHIDESAYKVFDAEHRTFLEKHPDADEALRKRRLQFIEREGLECALWPCLFWRTDLTFSHERASDPRRQQGDTLEEAMFPGVDQQDSEEPESEELDNKNVQEEDDDLVRHSVKRLFSSLSLGLLLGYTEHFEILQYVYDLHLWTDLGSKRNLGRGVPMRLMMGGASWSPVYWRRVQLGLVDLVRQVGFPQFFWTLSPSEWTMPYHVFVRNRMEQLLKERLHLPVEETLHIAHVLTQTAKGFLMGATGGKTGWTDNVFHVEDPRGLGRRLHAFMRLEFQDGTRKLPTQDYHGSGRAHLHMIIFGAEDLIRRLPMADAVRATLPELEDDADLRGYVLGSQLDHKGDSGREIWEAPTCFDEDKHVWRLAHSDEDHSRGLRAYVVDVLDALKCHQDFLIGDDKAGMLRTYITKYLSKFSDSASQEWLNDDADATSIATTVLMRYHPLEPEMTLQLFGQKFRQWHMTTVSGGKRDFVVPVPDVEERPKEVILYEAAAWARGKISLLDFLRKTTNEGHICNWLKKLHKRMDPETPLSEFAAAYEVQGEKVVAAEMNSRLSDRFYGQWLVLHCPFDSLADFLRDAERLARVPREHRYMGMAVLHGYGQSMETIEEELRVEGHGLAASKSILNMIRSTRVLVSDYMEGRLQMLPATSAGSQENRDAASGQRSAARSYNRQQERFKALLDKAVSRAVACRTTQDEFEADNLRQEARLEAKVLVCMGKPGSGKTTVCHDKIEEILQDGGRVLFALPTAQLASRMRERYARRIEVDTCHAAFGLHEDLLCSNMPLLARYDLVVVDEVSQLEGCHSDRIIHLWEMSDRLPALVFCGDKWQMSGLGDTRPWHTARWKLATFRTDFHHSFRCKDAAFEALLNKLRTAKPNAAALKLLQKRKAWAPPGPPTEQGLRRLLHSHPHTTILTCTRFGAQVVNECAMKALFPRRPALVRLLGDMESNPTNYKDGKLKAHAELQPLVFPVFAGMKVYLTKNVRKDVDYVNGMRATVVSYTEGTRAVRVKTATGHIFDVWKWTDVEHGNLTYYPIRPGYASTVLKFQGAELDHVTVYLDAKKVPGAAYTALSRVSRMDDFLLGGKLEELHFTPARN